MKPEDKTIYYKCLSFSRQSCVMNYYNEQATVTYPIKEWAFPKIENSKLMVFDNYCDAIKFTGLYGLVVKCYIKKSKLIGYSVLGIGELYNMNLIKAFWNLDVDMKYKFMMPKGTVFADAVYCLE